MAFRQIGAGIEQGVTTLLNGISGATTGIKLTYTCPAGRNAMVRWFSVGQGATPGNVACQVTVGGVTCTLQAGTATVVMNCGIALNAGDTATLNVAAAVPSSTFDGVISVEERSNA